MCHEDPNKERQGLGRGKGTTIFTLFDYFSTSESWNLNYLDIYPLPRFISAVSLFIFSTKLSKVEKQRPFLYNSFHTKRHLFTFKNPQECGPLLKRKRSPEGTLILGKGLPQNNP